MKNLEKEKYIIDKIYFLQTFPTFVLDNPQKKFSISIFTFLLWHLNTPFFYS